MIELEKMPKLGFGLMRLPESGGEIDAAKVCRMADRCLERGFNYFDTAYVYHGGKSESIVKTVLTDRHPRDTFYLATKLPAWSIKEEADRDRIFNEQLARCGVEYFDFYLLHAVDDGEHYGIYEKFDCFNWAKEKKAEGRIRHFGFSYHGTPELLEQILDKHPEVEFVQIQLNYADWDSPAVQSGKLYDILHARRIPVIVMEPVKGGKLASLAPELGGILRAARPGATEASWALRFAGSLDGVMTVLSGMSTQEQIEENTGIFSDFVPLSGEERDAISAVVKKMRDMPQVQCTACRYCCDGCPAGIKIPDVFQILNTLRLYPGDPHPKTSYASLTADSGKARDCVGCGQCEGVCPQHLPVIDLMKEAAEKLDQ